MTSACSPRLARGRRESLSDKFGLLILGVVLLGVAAPAWGQVAFVVENCSHADRCGFGGVGDADGQVQPGESVELGVTVRNDGPADATGVTVFVTALTPGVLVAPDTAPLMDLRAGNSDTAFLTYEVTADVPCGTLLEFQVDIRATEGNGMDTCSVAVPLPCEPCGPALDLSSCMAISDTCAGGGTGDANGSVDPGESIALEVQVTNSGVAPATNVVATFTPLTPGVVMTINTTDFPDDPLAPGATSSGSRALLFDVDAGLVRCGDLIEFDVALTSTERDELDGCSLAVPMVCDPCAPDVSLESCVQVSDSCAFGGVGDADGLADPGEDLSVQLTVVNDGAIDSGSVDATVSSPTPGVTITQTAAAFGPVASAASVTSPDLIGVSIDASVPCGTTIELETLLRTPDGQVLDGCSFDIPLACNPCLDASFALVHASHAIVADVCAGGGAGDGDGVGDPGESVDLEVEVRNDGPGDATVVTATLAALTPGVTVTSSSASYGDLAAAASGLGDVPFTYETDASVSCGDMLAFRLEFGAAEGPAPPDPFDLMIPLACTPCVATVPTLVHASHAVVADICAAGGVGDSDGVGDPGETVDLDVELRNDGPGDATAIGATLSALTPGVTVTSAVAGYGDLALGAVGFGDVPFAYETDDTVSCGDRLDFRLEFTAAEGVIAPDDFAIDVPVVCSPCVVSVPSLVHVSDAVVADSCAEGGSGDADGVGDPGETVDLDVEVRNDGPGDATAVGATLSALTAGVMVTSPLADYGNVAMGASGFGDAPFIYVTDGTVSCGDTLSFRLEFTADEGAIAPDDFDVSIPLACTPCMAGGGADEVASVDVACDGSGLAVTWTAAAGGVGHHVHQGSIAIFRMLTYDHACVLDVTLPELTAVLPGATCGDDQDLYFLVVGVDAAGIEGPNGTDSNGLARPAGSLPCP